MYIYRQSIKCMFCLLGRPEQQEVASLVGKICILLFEKQDKSSAIKDVEVV